LWKKLKVTAYHIKKILNGFYVYRYSREKFPNPERIVCKNVIKHIKSLRDLEKKQNTNVAINI